ncbi:MAG: LysM peptidoglycan-binding domain-containing protein [Muribaculaceae bacterium]|nr:LysM peptidoglycan-binding domain-containing protein [Muribaculaceae bacterium]
MKQLFIVVIIVSFASLQSFALDHVILRNGQEFDVKLHQITNENIVYSLNGNKAVARETIPSKDVYMIYIEKQGNVYLTQDGKRITGETNRVDPQKFDVIYLVKGGEIAAKSITLNEDLIKYSPAKKGGILTSLLGSSEIGGTQTLQNQDVFMIRYKSGMTDIITPIDKISEVVEEVKDEVPATPQYVVLFHAVTKGQNLKTIAEKYNVTVTQIIEWNDLPQRIKPTAPLTVGMQLMIYQPKQD